MDYSSTRNNDILVSASQAIARGISADGGLFVPRRFPTIDVEYIENLIPLPYSKRADAILSLFLTDFSSEEISFCTSHAYGKQFDTASIAPVHTLGDSAHILELWHGPTCAFKDMALQILPHLLTVSVRKTAPDQQTVILVATSGDTGKAALEGFKDAAGTRILVFFPMEGVSEMQRLQMVTQEGNNVGVCAIRGNFDDAQTGVKSLFTDAQVIRQLEQNGMRFSSANSINLGRLLPQVVYYISAYCDLVRDGKVNAGDPINIVVPTGNFGNILAAYYARQMGLPVAKLICASNRNRVLTDFFESGVYNCDRPFYTTTSPSMDILISSNLERLLYHLSGDDSEFICRIMGDLKENKQYTVPKSMREQMRELFTAGCATDEEVAATIRRIFEKQGYLCDTHTAVAMCVYDRYVAETADHTPTVIASTANPYKFAPAILSALHAPVPERPFDQLQQLQAQTGCPVPSPLSSLSGKPIRFTGNCGPDAEDMRKTVFDLLNIN